MVGTYDNGEASEDTFDEDTPFTPEPEKAMRVAIDNQVLAAAKDGLRSIVIRPTLIYGRGIGVPGISVQLPKLIDVAKKHGVPRHVGRGLNIWGHVHIADVADLFLLALDKGKPGSLFYAESGEANFKSVTQSIGRMLGLGDTTKDWPIGEAVEGLGPGRVSLASARTAACAGSARASWGGRRSRARCSTRSRRGLRGGLEGVADPVRRASRRPACYRGGVSPLGRIGYAYAPPRDGARPPHPHPVVMERRAAVRRDRVRARSAC